MATSKVVVVLEGLDLLEDVHQARNMEWLPNALPPVRFYYYFQLFRVVKTTLSSSYNISGLVPVCLT